MELDNMTKSYLDQICEITYHIFDLYKILIEMDLKGNKNSKSYEDVAKLLFLTIEEEKSLYTYFSVNTDIAVVASAYFVKELHISTPAVAFATIDGDEKEMMQTRILRTLNNIITGEPNYFILDIGPDLMTIVQDEDDGINYLYEVMPVLEKSTNYRLAGFIEDDIINSSSFGEKEYLVKTRYYLSFLEPYLEDYYLRTGFNNVDNRFYEDIDIHFDSVSHSTVERVREFYSVGIAYNVIDELMQYSDDDIFDEEISNTFKVLFDLLSTSLLYLNDANLKLFEKGVIDLFEGEDIFAANEFQDEEENEEMEYDELECEEDDIDYNRDDNVKIRGMVLKTIESQKYNIIKVNKDIAKQKSMGESYE